jgi:membrane protein YdbS with pleckstrin-like domain
MDNAGEWAADGREQLLDPRFIPLQRLSGRFATALMSSGLLVALFIVLTPRRWAWCLALWVAATASMAWAFHRWPAIAYRHTSYRVDADGLEIRRGVYWRTIMNVPRSRVQHTDVAEGPLERKYGLGRLVIYTAGTEHSRVELPGLERRVALRIRDHLLPRSATDAL